MQIYIYTYVQIYIVYVYIDMDSAEIWHLKLRPLDFELCLPTTPSLAVVGVGWKRKITISKQIIYKKGNSQYWLK